MKAQEQIRILHSYRGLAALIVCLGHIAYHVDNYFPNDLILKALKYSNKGVQVFFVISGIVIPLSMLKLDYSYKTLKRFLLKRLIRIEPPYLATLIVAGILLYTVHNNSPGLYWNDLPSLQNIVLHLGYLVPFVKGEIWILGAFWTLAIEFQYYLFLALIFPLVYWRDKLGTGIFFLILFSLPFIFPQSQLFPWWGAYFGLGMAFSFHRKKKISFIEYIFLLTLASIIIMIKQGILDLMIGLTILGTAHIFPDFKNAPWEFLGKISYSLYLTHFVGVIFIAYMSNYYKTGWAPYMVFLVSLTISILFAYVFWKYIERPSHRLSRRY